MNREQRVIQIKEHQLNTWEAAFTVFIEGEALHGTKAVERAIRIMNAIDSELTAILIAPEQATQDNTITVYHGTHENITQFIDREVKTYDSIGTYFTSNKDYARLLYGSNVIEANIALKNPLVIKNVTDCKSFDKVFYDSELTELQFNEQNMNKLLLDLTYINNLRLSLINKGYDGIIFQDSRIDLSKEDIDNHTVYIVFDTSNIQIVSTEYNYQLSA